MSADGAVVRLAEKFAEFRPHADERGWRFYLGSEARAYAREAGCPVTAAAGVVAAAAGVSRTTVMAGVAGLADGEGPLTGRQRRPGAGRRKAEESQPGLRRWRGCWRRPPGATPWWRFSGDRGGRGGFGARGRGSAGGGKRRRGEASLAEAGAPVG